jgi:hypothetical protein
MANISSPYSASSEPPPAAPSQPSNALPGRFEQILGRLRGTVTILGDVVNADPELWTCDRE